jgi:predicted glycoside hydrolase/deacetylase ChbG (UPF0249 family)
MGMLRRRPEIPFGVHLTLLCDTTGHRWGPLTPKETVPSLRDEAGELFSPANVAELLAQARLDEVELGFRAQINAVADAGLKPTHLDWHGTVLRRLLGPPNTLAHTDIDDEG